MLFMLSNFQKHKQSTEEGRTYTTEYIQSPQIKHQAEDGDTTQQGIGMWGGGILFAFTVMDLLNSVFLVLKAVYF